MTEGEAAALRVGDQVTFRGFGAQQLGTVERVGVSRRGFVRVVVGYSSGKARLRAKNFGGRPHIMRRVYYGPGVEELTREGGAQ